MQRKLLVLVGLLLGIIINSCSKESPIKPVGINIETNPSYVTATYEYGSSLVLSPYLHITSPDADSVFFQATTNSNWIQLIPKSGYTPDSIFAKISINSLTDGNHLDTVFITADGAANSPIMAIFEINITTAIEVTPNIIRYFLTEGSSLSDTSIIVLSGGGSVFSYNVTESSDWFSVTGSSGIVPDTISVLFGDVSGFTIGKYIDSINFDSDDISGTAVVRIELNITRWVNQEIIGGSSYDMQSISMVENTLGWAVAFVSGNNNSPNVGLIIKTQSGGETWELSHQISNGLFNTGLSSVKMLNAQYGWVVGESNTILRTVNGGASWQTVENGLTTDTDLNDIHFINQLTGWVAGENGTLLRTVNGGSVWVKSSSFSSRILSDVFFIDNEYGWVVGNAGDIYRSQNGGSQWVKSNIPDSINKNDFRSVNFVNRNKGWAVGESGIIINTTDGGANWTQQMSGTSLSLSAVQFIDSLKGWVVGSSGLLLVTDDGGETWVAQDIPGTNIWLKDIDILNKQDIWLVGDDGTILKGQVVQ